MIKINFNKRNKKKLNKLGFTTDLKGIKGLHDLTELELPCSFSADFRNFPIKVGAYTYNCGEFRNSVPVEIGRFCSIARDVSIGLTDHPLDGMSTSLYFYKKREGWNDGVKLKKIKKGTNPVIIGNDVWIGEGVKIKSGVKIGDGAVIACGAVVTKDIEPYAIIGGIPAKVIRYRKVQKNFAHKYQSRGMLTQKDLIKYESLFYKLRTFLKRLTTKL